MEDRSTVSLGIDVGSVSINIVAVDQDGRVVARRPYRRHFGRFLEYLPREYAAMVTEVGADRIDRVALTGNHGLTVARALDLPHEIETTAAILGLGAVAPDARTIIAIGGFDSAFFTLDTSSSGQPLLTAFKLNEACAAGTGSFIDQQAERIFADEEDFHAIEDQQERAEAILNKFIELGVTSDDPANVACRCTVFTKSDMIHLQNRGIPVKHIVRGLHDGVAKNFKSTLICNLPVHDPVYMIGGYARNRLAVLAFEELLERKVIVPELATEICALGTVLKARQRGVGRPVAVEELERLAHREDLKAPRTEPLGFKLSKFTENIRWQAPAVKPTGLKAFLGFDIGSTTSKIVLVGADGTLHYKRYIPTEGQPVSAIKKGLRHLTESLGSDIEVLGVGTTGSGREVAALFVGADDVVNEITAHAMGTSQHRPDVDTIFELGGQDAKYTALKDGYVVDFRMNKVCAAGTGSFLEETANKMGIAVDREYEDLAMASKAPLKLAERCTVFMESDLQSYLQQGAPKEDLLAGLAYAVMYNYLNRVVGEGRVGNVISFQGGPSLNKAVVAAIEKIVGKEIVTLPNREVIGAIGAALHARDELARIRQAKPDYQTRFYGFGIVDQPFVHEEEVCHRNPKCHNECKLQIYKVGDNQAVYGGDCGMYETAALPTKKSPDFYHMRQALFFKAMKGRYLDLAGLKDATIPDGRPTVGVPRTMQFHQLGLFWVHLLWELGYQPVITGETDHEIANRGIAAMTCETCFPIKLSHGHTLALVDAVDYLFLPIPIEMPPSPNDRRGFYCPYQQGNYHILKAALGLKEERCIHPVIHLQDEKEGMEHAFREEFTRLGLPFEGFDRAWDTARGELTAFQEELRRIGRATLDKLGPDGKAIIVCSRPYALYDARTNLNLFKTFSKLGFTAIPMEFLDLRDIYVSDDYNNMYWGFGEKIIRAARYIARDPRLFGLYLTSFSCGPDSFILHYFAHEMNDAGRPYLELELDEHSAGAGVETRLLAFIDVIRNFAAAVPGVADGKTIRPRATTRPLRERTVYLPYMAEGVHMLEASFRGVGIDAAVTPTYTKEGLEFAKRNTSGKECFPCTVTTGDMFDLIDKLRGQGREVEHEAAFFMPEADGPCRFGQYSRLHRLLLDQYGYQNVPILSPTCEDSYRFSGLLTASEADAFRKRAWHGIVYSDLIEKALWRVRPYEINAGDADRVFQTWLQAGKTALAEHGYAELYDVARKAAAAFEAIPRRDEYRPRIGIVGEIYVRSHKQCNQDLVRELEALGMETLTSSVAEWVEYTTWSSIEDNKKKFRWTKPSTWKELGVMYLTDWWQRHTYAKLMAPFTRLLVHREDHPVTDLMHEADGLLTPELNGEAILSIGGALAYVNHNGFDGVVNAMPFTCMPSTIASAVLKVAMRDKAPYIDMVYDGTVLPNRATNLSTFAHQVHQQAHEKGRRSA